MTKIYPQMTKKILLAFADVLNEIYIHQKQKNGEYKEYLVPLIFSSKEKMLSHIRSGTFEDYYKIHLPAMGYEVTTMDPDEERIMNPVCKVFSNSKDEVIFQPVPYNYTIDLGIYTKYIQDLFMIVEEIAPMFQMAINYPLIEFKFNDGSKIQRDLPIILQANSLNIQTIDIGNEDERVLQNNMTFIIKGWLYNSNKLSSLKLIKNIEIDTQNIYGADMFGGISISE